ncbi:hypothetical protein Q0M07_14365, partial [Staphylococcus aureus]|nr:hypothetical protein [Staphylococcus aureus]
VRQGDPADLLADAALVAAARLKMPMVLDLAARLGLDRDPDAAPLRDLDGLAERLRGVGMTRSDAGADPFASGEPVPLRRPAEAP